MAEPHLLVAEIEALGQKLVQAKVSINRRFIGQEKVVDLVLAVNHPTYPFGVGGAGVGDALFVMPVFLTLATIGANRLSETTLTRPVWVAQMKPVFLRT